MWEFYFIVPSNLSSAQENSFIKNLLFHKNKCENHHKSNQKNKYSKSIILFKTLGTQTTVKNSKMIDFRDLQQV
ncbi:hypothetical protein LEP1GSC151_0435 [Leptospira interrogans serovar Grippotyphosa str. LT2186]|uniref:Uncharacterized protein n=3 Tax=Leptospira interrogans TaxID=173 RepID=A0A0E2D8L4_LEPIR|nr:hypothetical protein LEP1GSC104_3712 [Leptospira interrogans str. UI 12621]EKR44661.1 hypothetical protein LEP1GSC097_2691 [Leptospira interrogans serovar Grippotyphosa str. UI 08368]EKR55806.1 hypothetical protein LEP1GSC105_2292 [Leptospira interrogans str. UI 12758]EMG08252.1 hypothetical protein LEP1GSC151_0435 [Leptospira interrogans serovar Grippotyphosa str. LT2186]EMN83518.1 hypothetical protein LEP1GSC107_0090 [Leptospira interrogans serovar Grippotyphosa str. UI 12769]EMO93708.1 h